MPRWTPTLSIVQCPALHYSSPPTTTTTNYLITPVGKHAARLCCDISSFEELHKQGLTTMSQKIAWELKGSRPNPGGGTRMQISFTQSATTHSVGSQSFADQQVKLQLLAYPWKSSPTRSGPLAQSPQARRVHTVSPELSTVRLSSTLDCSR